jgi:hypothetical protein
VPQATTAYVGPALLLPHLLLVPLAEQPVSEAMNAHVGDAFPLLCLLLVPLARQRVSRAMIAYAAHALLQQRGHQHLPPLTSLLQDLFPAHLARKRAPKTTIAYAGLALLLRQGNPRHLYLFHPLFQRPHAPLARKRVSKASSAHVAHALLQPPQRNHRPQPPSRPLPQDLCLARHARRPAHKVMTAHAELALPSQHKNHRHLQPSDLLLQTPHALLARERVFKVMSAHVAHALLLP